MKHIIVIRELLIRHTLIFSNIQKMKHVDLCYFRTKFLLRQLRLILCERGSQFRFVKYVWLVWLYVWLLIPLKAAWFVWLICKTCMTFNTIPDYLHWAIFFQKLHSVKKLTNFFLLTAACRREKNIPKIFNPHCIYRISLSTKNSKFSLNNNSITNELVEDFFRSVKMTHLIFKARISKLGINLLMRIEKGKMRRKPLK